MNRFKNPIITCAMYMYFLILCNYPALIRPTPVTLLLPNDTRWVNHYNQDLIAFNHDVSAVVMSFKSNVSKMCIVVRPKCKTIHKHVIKSFERNVNGSLLYYCQTTVLHLNTVLPKYRCTGNTFRSTPHTVSTRKPSTAFSSQHEQFRIHWI